MLGRKELKNNSTNPSRSSRSAEAHASVSKGHQSSLKNSRYYTPKLHLTGDRSAPDIKNNSGTAPAGKPAIKIDLNPRWADKKTRPSCKYAPVTVSGDKNKNFEYMKEVLEKRIATCKKLAYQGNYKDNPAGWFSFRKREGTQEHNGQEYDLQSNKVPIIVISGGSANKIAGDLKSKTGGSLAWHPKHMRDESIYLLVHETEFKCYEAALNEMMEQYKNLRLVGWYGGKLTGFGAARAAALAFADTLPYRPQQIIMMDQDVALTENTRHTNPGIKTQLNNKHKNTQKSIIGLGVGYPTREDPPKHFGFKKNEYSPKKPKAANERPVLSPAQQYVSIKSPFRKKGEDGIYAAYMVAGGEDMLMGIQQGLIQKFKQKYGRPIVKNIALMEGKIVKKELKGQEDELNHYWKKMRPETLKKLFEAEKDTQVEFDGKTMSLNKLMEHFKDQGYIEQHPSPESHNVAACIIERIILDYHKQKSSDNQSNTIFNTWTKSPLEGATSTKAPSAVSKSDPISSPLSALQKSERLRVSGRSRYYSE
ncbi:MULTISPECIES: hypothetical protein [Mycetohabitans]|uniref:hypothetical protein n=1 Tax=Mycetohabitans TaxID=2571159 RepID=UPI001F403F36|nr:hypothetical protein [Mycetohabitans sp. B3]MCF2135254.1 hypothetical protein [Mycetohabitans sp. B3]